MGFEGINTSVRRKEDHRLLGAAGNDTDVLSWLGELHARTHTLLGSKECGETGAIGSRPSFINAAVDAPRGGVRRLDVPAPAQKVWSIIQANQPRRAAE